jgi:hypothetical protein
VHVTVVEPTGNRLPLAGEHVTVVGGVPPITDGSAYETATGCPAGELIVRGAGHTSVGAAACCDVPDVELLPLGPEVNVDVGVDGDPLHPAAARLEAAATAVRA